MKIRLQSRNKNERVNKGCSYLGLDKKLRPVVIETFEHKAGFVVIKRFKV